MHSGTDCQLLLVDCCATQQLLKGCSTRMSANMLMLNLLKTQGSEHAVQQLPNNSRTGVLTCKS
jgi:hypothetical protein